MLIPMPVRLVITLKQSVRRCLYRRLEGQVVGRELRTETVDLERLYRGNTPYPNQKGTPDRQGFSNSRRGQQDLETDADQAASLGLQ